jgi:hypothetical protein
MTRATKAWAALLALSAGSTALAAFGPAVADVTLPVLALSGFKAHVILRDYLQLATAPEWLRGFDLGLALLFLAFAALTMAA